MGITHQFFWILLSTPWGEVKVRFSGAFINKGCSDTLEVHLESTVTGLRLKAFSLPIRGTLSHVI